MKRKTRADITYVTPANGTRSGKMWLCAIIAIHIILALVYWRLTPFGLPPDEGPHGKYVGHLAETMNLPVFDPTDRSNYEFHQPPLYYALGAPFYLVGKALGLQEPSIAVRLLSILLGALSIWLIYLAVCEVFGSSKIALSCAGFVAFLPTHVMLSSSVGNDILTELVYSAAFLLMVRQLRYGLTRRSTILTGIVIGAGVLTKTTCMLLFPMYALTAYLIVRRKDIPLKTVIQRLVAGCGIALLIGSGWLVRNTMLYGDPFGLKLFESAFQHTAKPEFFFKQGLSVFQYLELVATWTFASFWGVFGHMRIFMPTWVYIALVVVSLPMTAVSIGTWLKESNSGQVAKDILILSICLVMLVVLSFLRFNMSFFQAQGRYLYPALIPFAILWCLGASKRISPIVIYGIMALVEIMAIARIS